MLRQDQGLLLEQGHQPFGVSQLWVLGLGVALVCCCTAGRFAARLSAHLIGSPTRRVLRLGAGFAAAPFSFSLTLSNKSWAVTKPPRRSDQRSSRVAALMALLLHCVEASLFVDT